MQAQLESKLGITDAEAAFINANGNLPAVQTFKFLLSIQVRSYDSGGFALVKSALEAVRQLRARMASGVV